MKPTLALAIAACLQISVVAFAQKTEIRTGSGNIPSVTGDVRGQVVDENGKALSGATVTVKETAKSTVAGAKGKFTIQAEEGQTLIVANAGYEDRQIIIGTTRNLTIVLELNLASLLNTVVVNKGYYTTTQKLNTGNVSIIKAAEIEEQPVGNPLAALAGRAPGLNVTQSNGLPGAGFTVQVRGQNSILSGNDPFFLIDGVPFTNKSISLGVISANGSQSPFNNINPEDIESIEVLKDADATAIYGSRGANGVVLITTKKGKIGKTKLDLNVYTGGGKATKMIKLLNTQQYIQMRREAFSNDNINPDVYGAPDLVAWDTSRYTDWKKLLTGGTAITTDAQASLSGGNTQTQFLLGSGFHRETTVFPGKFADSRGSVHFNLTHNSLDNKIKVVLTASYSNDKNNLLGQDLTGFIRLPPNAPALYDSTGKLNWSEGGAGYSNPLASLLQKSTATADNLMSNLVLRYQLAPGLSLKTNLGYSSIQLQQVFIFPGASLNPAFNFTGFAQYSNNNFKSWIIEPQVDYQNAWGKGKLEVLIGSSFQQEKTNGSIAYASNFSSDALLESPSAAGSVSVTNNSTLYHYQAVFGRINFDWSDKYLLNLTGRRDGSSRFGPNRQFANFGAIGAAWIFSKEPFIKSILPALKYGKLRGSVGVTGNDQIGDYKYLNTYSSFVFPYQNQTGLVPTQLYNPDYSWETNRKSELGLELGFLADKIVAMVSYYNNRSSNQLINFTLPIQTGFNGVIRNFPALVQNTGWEYQLNAVIVKTKRFSWDASFNLTIARNKLLDFPNLSSSAYAGKYEIGKPLNIVKLVHTTGVDPQTGLFQFADKNGGNTSTPVYPDDYTVVKDLAPSFYGGLSHRLQYKGFSLSMLFQFVKQAGFNYAYNNTTPGSMANQATSVLNRWRKPGDITNTQLYTTSGLGSAIYYYYSSASDGAVSDASFVRLKNAALSYSFPMKWSSRIKSELIRFYLEAQNVVTWTKYKGGDPEIKSTSILPPLKVFTAGIQITF
ncbi:SusC/RagA family TonB-linked outer membrane protein [Flavitalea sp. BT771]|uniref:SusC/RagA family TonB-linked outer membrane protein n=1 Tax=Flavitalea sp. BT771 TaxID=3063329 RepID=UPI0026E24EA1|nr:SusC/RagA family TonB-linked outer membrane protein [Flavitalea sp. BT771]MDO6430838.1 SusC/RagA family TonB-linked outer membrane protein [Flavitalea sp. BT771]MDV6219022.1 SusC/RagA family TonB-linked outer membrane protein [Flavitalea sp. BT771]